ncbi:unnamed protein product [Psylliodes chrysocephalus]|uniref:Uncharacterized protein n=1 Tax=Psylliodes chrysocephalus TaxID=3402493 RepID=A0A9P0CZ23_9CUCU|nr:unnamed protein product [Psylliodes chrysocephala]
MSTNNEIVPYDQYDNNFINKLLGEMKSKFNKPQDLTEESKDESKIEVENEIKDEDIDTPEVTQFKKPNSESMIKSSKGNSPSRRSFRQKNNYSEEKLDDSLKRSSRRRSKESVLQNAIARKEKSYNESSKPQRLSRQLRPTKKVLENIAQAKEVKKVKMKTPEKCSKSESNVEMLREGPKKGKNSPSKNQRHVKRLKTSDSDKSESNSSFEDEVEIEAGKNVRKSRRISASQLLFSPKPQIADDAEDIPNYLENSIIENPELAVRLCLCTQKSKFYPLNNIEGVVYCSAVDSIDDRLVGCSREVNTDISPLLRPSQRIPYMSLCELHKNRLIRHNCCPTCGIFCTQGKFYECDAKHQYHQKCRLSVGNTECCPHCGLSTPSRDISLKFQCSNGPVFLPVQKSERGLAKMAFSKACDRIRCSTPLLIPSDSFRNVDNALTNGSDTTYSESDILDAISEEDAEKLTSAITSNSVDIHVKLSDFNDGSLLHYSASKGMLDICHLLISLGLPINDIDKEQNTALMLAITAHKMDVVQYLVRAGANIVLKGTDGMTALHVSAKCGNLDACRILIEAGSSQRNYVNCQDDGGWTPLVWACENGFSEIADFLISKGADPKLRDVEYNEALHWAAFSGCSHIVEMLVNRGCNVNTVNAHGETPLHIAAREDRYNCVIVLLARRADVFLVNKNNETALNCVPEDGLSYNPIALNMRLQSLLDTESRQYRIILSDDISKGREPNPVQCTNAVDDDLEPKDYIYITKSFMVSEGFSITTKPSDLQTCACEERCVGDDCLCGRLSVKCWYDEDGKLAFNFDFLDAPIIFECSDTCACNAITCRNRVVQRGTQQRFEVYKTERKGWSVRTLKCIPKGSFVCEYVGEILTDTDADRRDDDSFLFDLGSKETESFCVDAQYYGNLTRFINHSCDPNLHPIKVFIDHQDVRFPRIAFFALKDIPIGGEICFDYGPKFWIAKYKSFTCHCGSDDCRYSEENVGQTFAEIEDSLNEDSSLS